MQLPRQRVEAAARDRLRAPLHPLAALQDPADLRVRLQLLQQVVHRERRVAVVEPDDEPDRDHVLAHRVDERAAELAELLAGAQRPAHRVDDAVERLRDLPDLFHRELPDLRLLAAEGEAVDRDACEVALRPLRKHGDLGGEVGAGLEVAQLAALAVAPLVAGAHTQHAPVRDEELLGRGLRQDHRAALFRLLGEEAAELGEREDPVAVIPHRRRRRDRQRSAAGEDVDRLTRDLAVRREVLHPEARAEEAAQRSRVHDRAGEQVRTGLLALLEHGDRNVAELLRQLRVLLEQLAEPDRTGEAGRACTDDEHADLDPLVSRVGRLRDVVARRERRREIARATHPLRALISSVSFGTIACTSPTMPRSLKSKIGAFASLLMATIVPELCIPTLCWIAPEMPRAT